MPENYSKATLAHCLNEIGRLSNQDYFKADEQILEDLATCLARHCDDTEHATQMITTWKSSTRQMLHESDILALADQTAHRSDLPRGCNACLGTDFIVIERDGISGVKRCACARGRALAKMDQEKRYPNHPRKENPIAEWFSVEEVSKLKQ